MSAQGRLGDKGQIPADAHGCPGCPHPGVGPAVAGSPDVNVNARPALRVGDPGIHAACCGPNTWTAQKGSSTVFVNGKAAHRLNDLQTHCGGTGKLIEGSPDVFVGDSGGSGGGGGGGSDGSGSGAGGGGSGGGGAGVAAGSSTEAASAPPREPSTVETPPPEKAKRTPLVVSARWVDEIGRFSKPVKMTAICADAAGQTATFTVYPAEGGAALGTATGTCGDESVDATWTAHAGPTPDEVIFEVEIPGQKAKSQVLAFVVNAEGTVKIDGQPAADLELVLRSSHGTEHKGKTDANGKYKIEDVPSGVYRLRASLEKPPAAQSPPPNPPAPATPPDPPTPAPPKPPTPHNAILDLIEKLTKKQEP